MNSKTKKRIGVFLLIQIAIAAIATMAFGWYLAPRCDGESWVLRNPEAEVANLSNGATIAPGDEYIVPVGTDLIVATWPSDQAPHVYSRPSDCTPTTTSTTTTTTMPPTTTTTTMPPTTTTTIPKRFWVVYAYCTARDFGLVTGNIEGFGPSVIMANTADHTFGVTTMMGDGAFELVISLAGNGEFEHFSDVETFSIDVFGPDGQTMLGTAGAVLINFGMCLPQQTTTTSTTTTTTTQPATSTTTTTTVTPTTTTQPTTTTMSTPLTTTTVVEQGGPRTPTTVPPTNTPSTTTTTTTSLPRTGSNFNVTVLIALIVLMIGIAMIVAAARRPTTTR